MSDLSIRIFIDKKEKITLLGMEGISIFQDLDIPIFYS